MFNVFINLTFGYNFSWSLEHTLDLSLFNDWWKHTTSDKFILQIEWDCNFRQTWLNISSILWRNLLRKLMTHLRETNQSSFCCWMHSFALCGDKTHLWWHVHNPSPPWARSPMKEKTKTEYKMIIDTRNKCAKPRIPFFFIAGKNLLVRWNGAVNITANISSHLSSR